jgi:hypothetical protein
MVPESKFVNIEKPAQQASVAQLQYLSTRQAAAYLGVSRQTLEIGRHKGNGPIYCRPVNSRIVRYFLPDLDAWMQDSRRQHTAERYPPHKATAAAKSLRQSGLV